MLTQFSPRYTQPHVHVCLPIYGRLFDTFVTEMLPPSPKFILTIPLMGKEGAAIAGLATDHDSSMSTFIIRPQVVRLSFML